MRVKPFRALLVASPCLAGASCGYAAGPTSWCDDGPAGYTIPAGMEARADGTLLVASAWGKTDEGNCDYVRHAGGFHRISADGDSEVWDLPEEPGLAFAAGETHALVSGAEWFAGGIGGTVQHFPGEELFGVSIEGADAFVEDASPSLGRRVGAAGGRVFLLRDGAVRRYDGKHEWAPVMLADDAWAMAELEGTLVVALQSGVVVSVDPGTLSVTTTWDACASSSIAAFGPEKLALVCAKGVGILDTVAPASFAVLSTSERFVEVWGGPHVETALVTTTGGWTRVFTLASGAHAGLAGSVFDAELTPQGAYAFLVEAWNLPFVIEGEVYRIPFDDSVPQGLLEYWGPVQVEWAGSGDLVLAVGRELRRLDPVSGVESSAPIELEPPPMLDPPLPSLP